MSTTTREIKVYQGLMGDNEVWAAKIRQVLAEHRILMLNLIGAPGSGKTALLESMVPFLRDRVRYAVLEGDVETTNDAQRLDALGVPVSQLLSGGSCHLEAKLVHRALLDFPVADLDLVVVENVGNMVCPAEFDIGEHAKIAVTSVTEGEDKPLKYPLLFREAKAVVITKTDLLPHLQYDLRACRANVAAVHAGIPVFEVSARTGAGVEAFATWVMDQAK
ncbi:MAG: hydrogenase nickel incorporation protein HypB [Kiritimatiellia bacterium]